MAKKFTFGSEDLPDFELTDELKGTVVEVESKRGPTFWAVLAGSMCVVMLFVSWGYLIASRTEEDLYREKLADHRMLHAMLQDITRAVYLPTVTTSDLTHALSQALDVAHTEMRDGKDPGAPYIEERHQALIALLEGLLRLKLEGRFDERNSAQKATYSQLLEEVGSIELEFHESGLIRRAPILEVAIARKQLRKVLEKKNSDPNVIADARKELEDLKSRASFSVPQAAYFLGRWFRYQNQMEQAEQCFHIGRRFVEGYELLGMTIPGKRPQEIDPLWAAYAGSLEALAEIKFQTKNYRAARSYLSRMFHTPNPHLATQTKYELTHARPQDQRTEQGLRHDLGVLEQAIKNPDLLRSYPYFDRHDLSQMDRIAGAMIESAPKTTQTPLKFIWEAIDPEIRAHLYQQGLKKSLSEEHREKLRKELNRLILTPNLAEALQIDTEELSPLARRLVKAKDQKEQLVQFNREVLDFALQGAEVPSLLLSNGQRLTNALGHRAKGVLVGLYEQELIEEDQDIERRQWLAAQIEDLLKGTKRVTIQDFSEILDTRHQGINQHLTLVTQKYRKAEKELQQLREQIRQLEGSGQLNLREIKRLQQQEMANREQLQVLGLEKETLQAKREGLDELEKSLIVDLQQRADNLKRQLALFEGKQEHASRMENEEPLLTQIDQQISLREQYLELLTRLKTAGNDHEIGRLRIERVRLGKEIEVLKQQISRTSGDQREALEDTLADLEDRRTRLVQEFEDLFAPIRSIVDAVAAKEKTIWQAEKTLRHTRKELVQLLGSEKISGSLQQKTGRRQHLLQLKSEDLAKSGAYDKQIRELNRLISEDHAKLQMLLQREEEAKEALKLFYPHIVGNHPLVLGGDLEPLVNYLSDQGALMQHYQNLVNQSELLRNIHSLERGMVENLRQMNDLLAQEPLFSEEKTPRLTRVMQQVLLARKKLRENRAALAQSAKKTQLHAQRHEISARGYLMDSVDLFQMEKELGLNLTKARRLFEERQHLAEKLIDIERRKERLEQDKIAALAQRNQRLIDRLLPEIAEVEVEIRQLSEKLFEVQQGLKVLAVSYEKGLPQVQEYRKKIYPKMEQIHQRLVEVNQQMAEGDAKITGVVDQLFDTASKIEQTITALDADDLNEIDRLIEAQSTELARLQEVRSLKAKENYYKAKAIWLMGLSYYEQSRLGTYGDLVDSSSITAEMLRDQERNSLLLFEEYDESSIDSDDVFGDNAEKDANNAGFEMWVHALENQALSIFQMHIPRYAPSYTDDRGDITMVMSEDFDLFLARARFLTGKIHMNRGIRFVRSSKLQPEQNSKARKELDIAGNAFLSYLDYTAPFGYQQGSLTEPQMGSQEFPTRVRAPVQLDDEARVFLGVINSLKGDYLEAISYYRDLLSDLTLQNGTREIVDPMITEMFSYTESIHPYYASLLANHPLSHEALYRLGRNYQKLAQAQGKIIKEFVPPPFDVLESYEKREREYAERAISYYSQLILTHAYTPFRRPAYLQRALLRKKLGDYHGARADLVAILGSPQNSGGSFDLALMTSKGDLPGDLNPGYVQIAFELGKLHLENGNFAAAVEAFNQAQQSGQDNEFVLGSKIAYADTLMQSKQWSMAHLLLKELIEARTQTPEPKRHLYPIDLYLSMAKVNEALGNHTQAIAHLQEIFQLAPRELVDELGLNLSSSYGLTLLQTDYRDSIRPLAAGCMLYGDLLQERRQFDEANRYFAYAEKLWELVPWQEDRELQKLSRDEYRLQKQKNVTLARWQQHKTLCLDLLFATYLPFREAFPLAKEGMSALMPEQVIDKIDLALDTYSELGNSHSELIGQLEEFYAAESIRLPEEIEKKRVQRRLEQDKLQGGQLSLRYETLRKMRNILSSLQEEQITALEHLSAFFNKDSLEEHLLKQYVLVYAKELQLTEADRAQMHPEDSNIKNLLAIENSQERLKDFPSKMKLWIESEMRSTGLDDLFIPVSPIAAILEESHLYLASLLSLTEQPDHYRQLAQLTEKYIAEANKDPSRISQEETVWQLVEIGAMTANSVKDWPRSLAFHSFLLEPGMQMHFTDSAQKYRAELALAEALLELGNQAYEDAVFVQNPIEQSQLESKGERLLRQGRQILSEIRNAPGKDAGAVSARIQAKYMLQRAG